MLGIEPYRTLKTLKDIHRRGAEKNHSMFTTT
jgi:hypothetical protein